LGDVPIFPHVALLALHQITKLSSFFST
jgi:hypothetical protein